MRSLSWNGDYSLDMKPITKITIFGVRLATAVLAVYWIAIFTGTHMPMLPKGARSISDKLLHFTAFFGLALLLCWVWPGEKGASRKFFQIALLVAAYAAFDEVTQGMVRNRTTDVKDFLADMGGATVAISLYAFARKLWTDWVMKRSTIVAD